LKEFEALQTSTHVLRVRLARRQEARDDTHKPKRCTQAETAASDAQFDRGSHCRHTVMQGRV
jgi:hypothetical protein